MACGVGDGRSVLSASVVRNGGTVGGKERVDGEGAWVVPPEITDPTTGAQPAVDRRSRASGWRGESRPAKVAAGSRTGNEALVSSRSAASAQIRKSGTPVGTSAVAVVVVVVVEA